MDTYTNMYPHKSCTHTHNSDQYWVHQCAKGCTDVATGTWQAQYQVPRLQRSVCITLSSTIHLAGNKIWYFYVQVLRNKKIHFTARHTHLCSSVNFQNSQTMYQTCFKTETTGFVYNSCYSIKGLVVMWSYPLCAKPLCSWTNKYTWETVYKSSQPYIEHFTAELKYTISIDLVHDKSNCTSNAHKMYIVQQVCWREALKWERVLHSHFMSNHHQKSTTLVDLVIVYLCVILRVTFSFLNCMASD